MKFYMAPGSCTTGIHILLEELELTFEAFIVNLPAGEHLSEDYIRINPKSTIPTLVRDDGQTISEYQAIAYWLARSYPHAGLLPEAIDTQTRVLENLNYVVNTLHGQGFARLFTTEQFCADEKQHAAIKQHGRDIINKGFAVMNTILERKHYLADNYSIADTALFYVEFWADKLRIPLPDNCDRHYHTMLKRPAVKKVLLEEGYHVPMA